MKVTQANCQKCGNTDIIGSYCHECGELCSDKATINHLFYDIIEPFMIYVPTIKLTFSPKLMAEAVISKKINIAYALKFLIASVLILSFINYFLTNESITSINAAHEYGIRWNFFKVPIIGDALYSFLQIIIVCTYTFPMHLIMKKAMAT